MPGLGPSDTHLRNVFACVVAGLLAALVFPPAFVVLQVAFLYWVALFCWTLLRVLVASAPKRPRANYAAPSEQPAGAVVHPEWEREWKQKCESVAEEAFLSAAIAGFSLRPQRDCLQGDIRLALQVRIGRARVDFLANDALVVEVDGAAYHSSPQQRKRDALRDRDLRARGYEVLRLPAKFVFTHPDLVVTTVRQSLNR